MKIRLISQSTQDLPAKVQILLNRGMAASDIQNYLNADDSCINEPELLNEDLLRRGARMLMSCIKSNQSVLVVVDSDCDGFTSAAILINYLHDLFPSWVENKLSYTLHSGKQHGLSDIIKYLDETNYKLIILPDSSSNDFEYHAQLAEDMTDVLVLDHHEAEVNPLEYQNACIINNQLSDYPNKQFSGAGITWQFCRYMDKILNLSYAEEYIDLVALGNLADMMSLKSIETKYVINKGFENKNVKNPFIYEMWQKNSFSIGDHITPIGAAFYIAPFVNAMVRSGTQEEKELLFKSMLRYKAFDMVLSTKRGHKLGEEERLVDQAVRVCTNVKNRQTRVQDSSMEFLEKMIEDDNMMEHKVLLFLLEPGQIDRNIAGLCANKIMAKYQRPCCILTKVTEYDDDTPPWEEAENTGEKITYQGSARGYSKSGIESFKDICETAPGVSMTAGHANAFGLGLNFQTPGAEEVAGDEILRFIDYTDEILKDMSAEPMYYVDYIWDYENIDPEKVLEIADMEDMWGQEVEECLVYVKNISLTADNFKVMARNTLKIDGKIPLIKFNGSEEDIEALTIPQGRKVINAVCRCNKNEYNWQINPQLFLVDYEFEEIEQNPVNMWGF